MRNDYMKKTKEDCLSHGYTLEYWTDRLNTYTTERNKWLEKKSAHIKKYDKNPRGALGSQFKSRIESAEWEMERANHFIKLLQS